MILTHVPNSWLEVLNGQRTPESSILRKWYKVSDAKIEKYGDVVAGIHDNTVVGVYDVTGWTRDADEWVTFTGTPSAAWAHLIGTPNPGKPWGVRGMARPIQYLDTSVLINGTVAAEDDGTARRAVIDGFALVVDNDGSAVLSVPAGRRITVLTNAA
ncbi:hypothetical protein [Streptomyces sp. x-80]|uniref:hypothetical protein n=1 Tax=Streptomyces sp. x-80 TaxID=2789282 RepID=UPI00397FE2E8